MERVNMEYEELYKKYLRLLKENEYLKSENEKIQKMLLTYHKKELEIKRIKEYSKNELKIENNTPTKETDDGYLNNQSSPEEKINLYLSLFKGRKDVYAKRWEKADGKSGYTPVCLNEWNKEFCEKPRVKCSQCTNKKYELFSKAVINKHLRGSIIAGIYPLLEDEKCNFLAIDFDDGEWKKDVSAIVEVCKEFNIPFSIERSRSGDGAHMWFFFKERIEAPLARKFGSSLLTYAMEKRYQIKFSSYDRLFPNQDYMPKGGFGNLIALPLQKNPRLNGNSAFVDENFEVYRDQWNYLSTIKKIAKEKINYYLEKLKVANDLGSLIQLKKEVEKPWIQSKLDDTFNKIGFPEKLLIVKANMIYIEKYGLENSLLNRIKRFAAFKNPEFYKAQAMRLPTYDKPRIISLSVETEEYLSIPRGCEDELFEFFKNCKIVVEDKRNNGKNIKVKFNGNLREEQNEAVKTMLSYDNGVLSATTAFGKTVIGAYIISKKKVNTLIIVHTTQLLEQWHKRLEEFLILEENIKVEGIENKKSKILQGIGQYSGRKNRLTGIVDIATMQSLSRNGEVKEFVKDYGMVIVDECHHVSAFNLEQILKKVNAKFVYGLTATPIRKDGHDPIIFMQCGPLRYRVDPIKQADMRPFEHYIIPRFTSFRVDTSENSTINDIYSEIIKSNMRNKLITEDVLESLKRGRNSIVLTERTAHADILSEILKSHTKNVIILNGSLKSKERKDELEKIRAIPKNESFVIVATGKFVGEGFDEPRLDTLFLAMPISWKGTLQQYSGRLHRLYENKIEVQVYDYVDIHLEMLTKMYQKRLKGYADIGYKVKGNLEEQQKIDTIYNGKNYWNTYIQDLIFSKKEIFIASPNINETSINKLGNELEKLANSGVKITIVTNTIERIKETIKNLCFKLQSQGINIIFKEKTYNKFTVIDNRVVWYGGISTLGFTNLEESIMRIEDYRISKELLRDFSNKT